MILRGTPGKIPPDLASELGVEGGEVPETADIADRRLQSWQQMDPWCAPLVVAGPHETFDFTKGYDPGRKLTARYGFGRYDEDRVGMYEAPLFKNEGEGEMRTVHMGLDVGAAEGTPIFAPVNCQIWGAANLANEGDYGGTLVLQAQWDTFDLFMLLGHLSKATTSRWKSGDRVEKGDLLGWLGGPRENGGWNPHLHWQLSWLKPLRVDLPGAVRPRHRDWARRVFPDPTPCLGRALAGIR